MHRSLRCCSGPLRRLQRESVAVGENLAGSDLRCEELGRLVEIGLRRRIQQAVHRVPVLALDRPCPEGDAHGRGDWLRDGETDHCQSSR